MRLVNRVSMILLAGGAFGLAACGGGGDDDGPGNGGGDVNPDGTHTGYVVDSLMVPANTSEATAVQLDIDGDGRAENALGGILATVASFEIDIQSQVDAAVAEGTVIILADLQATSLTEATGVGLQVFRGGTPDPMPCADEADMVCGGHLGGDASFTVAEDYDALVVGSIVGGAFTGGPGEVTIELALSEGNAVPIRLVGARVETNVSESGLTSGKLGGAITTEDVDMHLIPAVADIINGIVAECEMVGDLCCPEDSAGEQVLTLFNDEGNGGDCMVTDEELLMSDIAELIRNPDLDLFNGSEYDPNQDGERDSISLGVGFTAVSASFTP
jgi:hypothetical protein